MGQFLVVLVLWLIPIIFLILIFSFDFDRNIFRGVVTNFIVIILSAYYLVAATFAFMSWMSFYYSIYIVTCDEIIEITQIGFLGRKISQLSLLRVQDVTSSVKGIFPTLFSYGDVLVETAGEQENFLLQAIANPQEVSSKIMELHDKAINREERQGQLSEGEGTLMSNRPHTGIEKEIVMPMSHIDQLSHLHLSEREKRDEALSPEEKAKLRREEPSQEPQEFFKPKPSGEKSEEKSEGEISKDDLEKGGEIDMKS